MPGVLFVFALSLFICCVIAFIMGMLWFSDIRNRRLRSFFILGIEIFFWVLLNAITMIVRADYFPIIYTLRMVMVCIIPFGVTWFILNFIGSSLSAKAWVRNLLIFLASADILCMVTNPFHYFYFSDYSFPMPARAPLFWLHIALVTVIAIIAITMLMRYITKMVKNNPPLILTGVGLLIPYTINMLYTFGMIPFDHDITPIGFFIAFMLFVYFAYRSRLFNIKSALFSTAMDSLDDLIILCNEKDEIIDANQNALDVFHRFPITFNRTKTDEFFEYLNKTAVEIQPTDLTDSIFKGSDVNGEYSLLTEDGSKRVYTLSRRTVYEGKSKSGFIFKMTDISDDRKMISTIEHQEELLRAANRAATFLLNSDNESFENDIFQAMKAIGETVKVDRVYVWENHTVNGQLYCTQVYEWSEGAQPQQANEYTVDVSYNESMMDLEEVLSSGKSLNGVVSKMDPVYQAHLVPQGIVSILILPVFINEQFWGFVGFDDCHNERVFTEEEEMILRSGGLLFAHAYRRNGMLKNIHETANQLKQRDDLLQAVNSAAVTLLNENIEDFNTALSKSMGIIAEAVMVDRVYIWKNHTVDGLLHCTQLYEWSEGAEPQQGLENTINISYSENIPGWEETLSSGRCVNNIVCNLSKEAQDQLSPQGIVSILVVPIFIRNQFWGFVGFDDCHNERTFTEEEEAILRSCSLLFAHSYRRNELNQDIRDTSIQLETALNDAKVASKAKGDFLSNMSHEMRTPMNAIIGMTNIGKKANGIVEKNHALNKIGDAASHLLGVINDVLDMAKIEADKLELAPVEYNFEKMLQKVATVINFRIDEKRQHFLINIDNTVPRFIVGDDQRLAQVITNLLSNAVKFTPEGGKITLNVSFAEENGDLYVEVADNGIGMSSEQQNRLFIAFEQAESGTSRKYGGTGLGLVITKRIVELMGGEIWVESEFGKGSRFIFNIKTKRGNKSVRSLLLPGVNWKNVRIMVVDDMIETRNQFQNLFSHLDIKCDVAADGIEAWQIIEERGGYDIYFVDWQMPGMDGVELTKKIKSHNKDRQPVVIMITALDWELIRDEAMQAGVDRHLLKPLFSSTIIDCVNECLGIENIDADPMREVDSNEFDGKRMLLAEDIEINREILMALLEDTGIIIDCAENGQEALDMVTAAPDKYDIIFMDMQMPKIDGLEATRRIRALPALQNSKLPIIAMTANVFKDDIEACLAAGMNDHIGKPLDIEKVMEKLHKHLKTMDK